MGQVCGGEPFVPTSIVDLCVAIEPEVKVVLTRGDWRAEAPQFIPATTVVAIWSGVNHQKRSLATMVRTLSKGRIGSRKTRLV